MTDYHWVVGFTNSVKSAGIMDASVICDLLAMACQAEDNKKQAAAYQLSITNLFKHPSFSEGFNEKLAQEANQEKRVFGSVSTAYPKPKLESFTHVKEKGPYRPEPRIARAYRDVVNKRYIDSAGRFTGKYTPVPDAGMQLPEHKEQALRSKLDATPVK